tara:strand:+ start:14 stop:541 length:528 start_codon:yes stop_codon:yes gene_type:complete
MENLQLPIQCVKTKFEDFEFIKPFILNLLTAPDPDPHDTLSEVDWNQSQDFNRPWVKYLIPHLSYNLTKLAKSLNYSNIQITNIWYQRYESTDFHSWHTHSNHYTGVFYIEKPKSTPPTQLSFGNDIIDLEASEGDIIIFPSLVVHRSPVNTSNEIKTIISFNFNINADGHNFPK